VFGNELAQECDVFRRNDSAPVLPLDRHIEVSLPEFHPERKQFFMFLCFALYALTRRHSGGASASGLPAAW
jgi:hypothetical protein